MTLAAQIRAWITGDRLFHQQAIALYAQIKGPYPYSYFADYIHSPFLPDPVEKNLLEIFRAYLEAHRDEADLSDVDADQEVDEVDVSPFSRKERPEPDTIVQLRERGRQWMKQQSYLHAQLSNEMSDKERFHVAQELMEVVRPNVDRIYRSLRNYEETGEIPAMAAGESLKASVADLMNKRNTLRSRISRLKGKLSGVLPPEDEMKYEKELLEKQYALMELEKELE